MRVPRVKYRGKLYAVRMGSPGQGFQAAQLGVDYVHQSRNTTMSLAITGLILGGTHDPGSVTTTTNVPPIALMPCRNGMLATCVTEVGIRHHG
jgi:hypothetical protein